MRRTGRWSCIEIGPSVRRSLGGIVLKPTSEPPAQRKGGFRRNLWRLWRQLPANQSLIVNRKVQVVVLLLSMLASGVAEAISVAAMIPFLTALTAPEKLWQSEWLGRLLTAGGITEPAGAVVPVTLGFACLAVLAGVVRIANLWLTGRVLAGLGSDLSCEAYRRALLQPYATHVSRSSSSVIHTVTTQVSRLVHTLLLALLQLVVSLIVVACLAGTLLALSPWTALVTVSVLAAVYLGLSQATRKSLVQMSHRRTECGREVVKNVQEGLGGIRDVILGQSFGAYLQHYRQHDWPLRQLTVRENLLNEFPAHAVTAGAFVAMAGLACLLVTTQGGLSEALPSLGLLAMGGQRMLPAVHVIYYSIGQIRGSEADLEGVLAMLEAPVDESLMVRHQPAPFAESIALDHVSFRYTADGPDVIRKMSLSIDKGTRVAIVGPSGSGKSTLADLLMGLLEPTSGQLLIDGRKVPTLAWQANIAHVPQSIFLADASLAENIALGIPLEEIDRPRLEAAARAAQIGSFIDSLPKGFETTVGERGIRLSGGQRQRIGIARALYKQAPVLVLDEATSALDDATERAVMETLEGLSRDLTIIMIAHRISTTAYCDRILTVDPTAPENGVRSSFSQTQQ